MRSRDLEATDVRDMAFGMLGLVENPRILADYSLSSLGLYHLILVKRASGV